MHRLGLIVAALAAWMGIAAHVHAIEPPADIPVEAKIVTDEGLPAMQAWFLPGEIQPINTQGWGANEIRLRLIFRPARDLFVDMTNVATWTVTGQGVTLVAPGIVSVAQGGAATVHATAGGVAAHFRVSDLRFHPADGDPPEPGQVFISGEQIRGAIVIHVFPPLIGLGMPMGPWLTAAGGGTTFYSNSGAASAAGGSPQSVWLAPEELALFHKPGSWRSTADPSLSIRAMKPFIVLRNDQAKKLIENAFTEPNGLYQGAARNLWNELVHSVLWHHFLRFEPDPITGNEDPFAAEEVVSMEFPHIVSNLSQIAFLIRDPANVNMGALRTAVQMFQSTWRHLNEHANHWVRFVFKELLRVIEWVDDNNNDVPDWLDRTLNPFFPNGIPKVWPQQ